MVAQALRSGAGVASRARAGTGTVERTWSPVGGNASVDDVRLAVMPVRHACCFILPLVDDVVREGELMLERLENMPTGVDGIRAAGTITREDYDLVVEPILEEARRDGRRIRLLAQFDADFAGLAPRAAWEGLRVGVHHLRRIERCAIVSDNEWVRVVAQLKASVGFMLSCSIKVFHAAEREAALQFLSAAEDRPPMAHRILPGQGVLVLAPRGPLREEDFEACSADVDPWIAANGSLRGVVIHARHFPGWENLGGLLSHLRFVRDLHHKVRRVALVVDIALADLAPKVASHFIEAEVKHFPYDDIVDALAWVEKDDDAKSRPPAGTATAHV